MADARYLARDAFGNLYVTPWPQAILPALSVSTQPTISGTVGPGKALTAVVGTYLPVGLTLARWTWTLRNSLGVKVDEKNGAAYTIPTTASTGTLTLTETRQATDGRTIEGSVVASLSVVVGAPAFTVAPSISAGGLSSVVVGTVLTANDGTATGSPAPTKTRRWMRDGVAISGQTATTYTTVSGDDAKTITLEVTASNGVGTPAVAVSAGIAVYTTVTKPVFTVQPTISRNATSGVFTANYTVTGQTSIALRWYSADTQTGTKTAVTGATSATWTPAASYAGKWISFQATATNGSGSTDSSFATPVQIPALEGFTKQPVVSGTFQPGNTISTTTGTYLGAPTKFVYEWVVDGVLSTTLITSSFKLSSQSPGKKIKGRVVLTYASGGVYPSDYSTETTVDDPPVVPVGDWPAMYATGTGRNELRSKVRATTTDFYGLPYYQSATPSFTGYDTSKFNTIRGEGFGPAAYASFTGVTETDDFVLKCIRSALVGGQDPSMQGGYSAQHELSYYVACYFASKTPRLWTGTGGTTEPGLTLSERNKIDLQMRAAMVAHAVAGREVGDPFSKNMLGNSNSSTPTANPNIGCGNRMVVIVCAAYLGGAAAGKAYLDSIVNDSTPASGKVSIQSIYSDLVAAGLSNAAKSFVSTGRSSAAPSYAEIAAKCVDWKTRGAYGLEDPNNLVAGEINFAYSKTVKTRAGNNARDYPAEGYILGTATSELTALVGKTGMLVEFETFDEANSKPRPDGVSGPAQGDRSCAEYGILALRVMVLGTTVALVSGMASKDNASMKTAMAKFKVGNAMFMEITRDTVGWYSTSQAGEIKTGPWYWEYMSYNATGSSKLFGMLPWFALGDVCNAIMAGGETIVHDADYFDNDGKTTNVWGT